MPAVTRQPETSFTHSKQNPSFHRKPGMELFTAVIDLRVANSLAILYAPMKEWSTVWGQTLLETDATWLEGQPGSEPLDGRCLLPGTLSAKPINKSFKTIKRVLTNTQLLLCEYSRSQNCTRQYRRWQK